ncbi:MAG TPA: BON domain-containing protein [Gammaproteobacteria bacterium]|nr:BON domain-containing protein [Gammaproteobacteria bacterium]
MKITNRVSTQSLLLAAGLALCVAGSVPAVMAADSTPTAHSDNVGAAISDTDITAKIKYKMAGKHDLKGSDIHVTTTNGVVTLTGTAKDAEAKDEAENIAKSVEGVKDVDDSVTTGSSSKTAADAKAMGNDAKHAVSDSWITTKVKSELLADSVTKGFDVKVATTRGVVVLSGKLPNKDAVAHAKDLAEKVDGVKSVDTSGLTVSPS